MIRRAFEVGARRRQRVARHARAGGRVDPQHRAVERCRVARRCARSCERSAPPSAVGGVSAAPTALGGSPHGLESAAAELALVGVVEAGPVAAGDVQGAVGPERQVADRSGWGTAGTSRRSATCSPPVACRLPGRPVHARQAAGDHAAVGGRARAGSGRCRPSSAGLPPGCGHGCRARRRSCGWRCRSPGRRARPSRPRSQKSWTCGWRSTTWVGWCPRASRTPSRCRPSRPRTPCRRGRRRSRWAGVSPLHTAVSENPVGSGGHRRRVGAADRVAGPGPRRPLRGRAAADQGGRQQRQPSTSKWTGRRRRRMAQSAEPSRHFPRCRGSWTAPPAKSDAHWSSVRRPSHR